MTVRAEPTCARPSREPSAFDFDLPEGLIAQRPLPERDESRMLCLGRTTGAVEHTRVCEWPSRLDPGDLVVVNTTRVLQARLRGRKETGGRAEALLLAPAVEDGCFRALVRCRGRLRVGMVFVFARDSRELTAEVSSVDSGGCATLRFGADTDPYALGEAPLPPYIRRKGPSAEDDGRYQTVYATEPGAIAAPTAGLHLSQALLDQIRGRGVELAEVVLHVGIGTFRPLTREALDRGELHPERYRLPEATAEAIARTRERGGRVVAVGTTTTRVLEACAAAAGHVRAGEGETRLFLRPGSRFQVVDALLTNFHLPRSSLLMLVAALAGTDAVLRAYREAVASGYRFYSYGDCMWIS